jgi:23S rRNA pseudouridine2605 synthase
MERLQKILSQAGIASRRASEKLMLEGRVTVNGITVRELGTKAEPSSDDIRVDGRRIKLPERHRYLLLNKPRGYVTTRSDPEKRPTVIDLLGGIRDYVYPVGRLDFDSEGLLLLTNDGDLAARLTHPSHGVARVYEARVLGVPDAHDLDRLARGVTIDGRRTGPAEVHVVPGRQEGRATLRIAIREGRNRQVRKMLESIGHPVDHLTRVAIGPIRDNRLKLGRWRELTDPEVASLKKAASHEQKLHHGGHGDKESNRPENRAQPTEGQHRNKRPHRHDGRDGHGTHVRREAHQRQETQSQSEARNVQSTSGRGEQARRHGRIGQPGQAGRDRQDGHGSRPPQRETHQGRGRRQQSKKR